MKEDLVYLSGEIKDKGWGWDTLKGLTMWLLFISISMGIAFWFLANGTSTEQATVAFYDNILISFTFFVSMFPVIRILASKFFHKDNIPLDYIIHNPTHCILNRIFKKKLITTKRLVIICLIFGFLYSLLIWITPTRLQDERSWLILVASPKEYSIDTSNVRSAYLKANPTSPAENLLIFGFFQPIIYILLQKYAKIPWHVSFVMTIFIIGVVGFPAYHWKKYGEKETDLQSTMVFGVSNSVMSGLTGSLMFTEFFHQINNGMGELKSATSFGLSIG